MHNQRKPFELKVTFTITEPTSGDESLDDYIRYLHEDYKSLGVFLEDYGLNGPGAHSYNIFVSVDGLDVFSHAGSGTD